MSRIEESLEKLTSLVQTIVDHRILQVTPKESPSASLSLNRARGDVTLDRRQSSSQPLTGVTRPVLLVRNLQAQFFGPKRDFSDEQLAVGSIVAAGIISPSLAQSLVRV